MKAWAFGGASTISNWWSTAAMITLPSRLQKRLVCYLLKRTLGQLVESLDPENLDLQLKNGIVQLRDLRLNIEALNEIIKDLPMVITEGSIEGITASIPWLNLWSGIVMLEIQGLQITVLSEKACHKEAYKKSGKQEDSPLLSSSLYFAGDFLRHEVSPDEDEELRSSIYQSFYSAMGDSVTADATVLVRGSPPCSPTSIASSGSQASPSLLDTGAEGLQVLTRIIDNIVARVRVEIHDARLRIRHCSQQLLDISMPNSEEEYNGYLEMHIPLISYRDETPNLTEDAQIARDGTASIKLPPHRAELVKKVNISGFTILLRQFSAQFGRSITRTILSCQDSWLEVKVGSSTPSEFQPESNLSSSAIHDRMAQLRAASIKQISANFNIGPVLLALCPEQLAWILELCDNFSLKTFSEKDVTQDAQNDDKQWPGSENITNQQIHGSIEQRCTDTEDRSIISPTHWGPEDDYFAQSIHERHADIFDFPYSSHDVSSRFPKITGTLFNTEIPQYSTPQTQYQNQNRSDLQIPSALPKKSHQPVSLQITGKPCYSFKFNINSINAYMFYQDELIEEEFFRHSNTIALTMDHIRIKITNLVIIYRNYDYYTSKSISSRRDSGESNRLEKYGPAAPVASEGGTINVRISSLSLAEWLDERPPMEFMPLDDPGGWKRPFARPDFQRYNFILYFNPDLPQSYDQGAATENGVDFPTFLAVEQGNPVNNEDCADSRHEAITVCYELGVDSPTIHVEILPLCLRLDVRIIDRLENYFSALSNSSAQKEHHPAHERPVVEYTGSQRIIDDLDERREYSDAQKDLLVRVHCEFIRVWLFCPAMGIPRPKFPAGESSQWIDDRMHMDVLVIDLLNPCFYTSTALNTENGSPYSHLPSGGATEFNLARLRVECPRINLFLKAADDHTAVCFLTIQAGAPLQTPRAFSQSFSTAPNIEITVRCPEALRTKMAFTGAYAAPTGYLSTFTRRFSGSDETVHAPPEEEEEEILVFKQRTVESSLFVINCHFPVFRGHIPKHVYNIFEVLLNDFALFQPRNSSTENASKLNVAGSSIDHALRPIMENLQYSSPSPSADNSSAGPRAFHKDDESTSESQSSFRGVYQMAKGYEEQINPARPTLASLVVFISRADLTLLQPGMPTYFDPDPTTRAYRLILDSLRYFNVMKHRGQSESYVIMEMDNLALWDITNGQAQQKLLCYRTLDERIGAGKSSGKMSRKKEIGRTLLTSISFSSLDTELFLKETKSNVSIRGITWRFSIDQRWPTELAEFQRIPEEMMSVDLPSQYTRLQVHVQDCSIDYKPINLASRAVLVVDALSASANIISDSPTVAAKIIVKSLGLFLVDDASTLNLPPHRPPHQSFGGSPSRVSPFENDYKEDISGDVRKHWLSMGFARIASLEFVEANVRANKLDLSPQLDIELTDELVSLELCADTIHVLEELISHLVSGGDLASEHKNPMQMAPEPCRHTSTSIPTNENILASIDEDAFRLRDPATTSFPPNPSTELSSTDRSEMNFVEEFYAVDPHGRVEFGTESVVFAEAPCNTPASLNKKISKQKWRSTDEFSDIGIRHNETTRDAIQCENTSFQGLHGEHIADGLVRILDNEFADLNLVEDHFAVTLDEKLELDQNTSTDLPPSLIQLRVRDFNLVIKLYGGFDWESSRVHIKEKLEKAKNVIQNERAGKIGSHSPFEQGFPASFNIGRLSSEAPNPQHTQYPNNSDSEWAPSDQQQQPYMTSAEAYDMLYYDDNSDVASQISAPTSTRIHFPRDNSRNDNEFIEPGKSHSRHISPQKPPATSHKSPTHLKLMRSRNSKIELQLNRIQAEFNLFHTGGELASRLIVQVQDLEVIDNLRSSLWRKFLTRLKPSDNISGERSGSSANMTTTTSRTGKANSADESANRAWVPSPSESMLRVNLLGVKPNPEDAMEEYRLKFRLLPVRFYVDQDALDFLIRFFSFKDPRSDSNSATQSSVPNRGQNSLYFQYCEFRPIIMKIDYKPKHINYRSLKRGHLVELMNLFHLDGAEMTLREVRLTGVDGLSRLFEKLLAEWLPHIRSTQVPHMVSGVSPIRSLVNVGQGMSDLILLPIEQYRRDGRLVRGLQRGTGSFVRATTLEAIKVGTRFAAGTQVLLEYADETLSGSPSSSSRTRSAKIPLGEEARNTGAVIDINEYMAEEDGDDIERTMESRTQLSRQTNLSKFADQPADVGEGIQYAYRSLSRNIGMAAQTILAVPMEVYESTSAQGTVRAVVRAVPVAVLRPMIGATEAFSNMLLGIRNTIDPAQKIQSEDKYKQ
ncbi:uncharacterized protein VTP21DRAFT_8405 [Calcarisporiella thermophila]|uniref:uncharacterized protein n=1 Tax=Calcarisporiella thermophila TaxID=911321 RepID=UPI00374415AD